MTEPTAAKEFPADLRAELIQTLFRMKNMRGFFRHHHPSHSTKRGFSEQHGIATSSLVILDTIERGESCGERCGDPRIERALDAQASHAQASASGTHPRHAHAAQAPAFPDSREGSFATVLQERLHVSKAAISQNLLSLEKKGLITRTINPNDLRRFDFALTDKGRRITEHMHRHVDDRMNTILDRMGEKDTKELIRLFNKFVDIVENLSPADLSPEVADPASDTDPSLNLETESGSLDD